MNNIVIKAIFSSLSLSFSTSIWKNGRSEWRMILLDMAINFMIALKLWKAIQEIDFSETWDAPYKGAVAGYFRVRVSYEIYVFF